MKALVLLGLPIVVVGLGAMLSQRDAMAKHGRFLSRPLRRIEDVSDGDVVAVAGTAQAIAGETIEAPLTGKEGVWARSETRTFDTVFYRDVVHVPFLVDDGSAVRARVTLDGAFVAVRPKRVGYHYDVRPPTKGMRSALAVPLPVRGRSPTVDYVEAVLAPGDRVYVVGRARVAREPTAGGYRGATAKDVLFERTEDDDGELYVGSSKGALAAGLRFWFVVGVVVLVAGLATMSVGVAAYAGVL